MKARLQWLFISLTILTVTSCSKEINLEDFRPAPKLVLNSVMVVGEPVTASVSRTWFYADEKPNVTIQDADVNLYVNDRLQEKMVWYKENSEYFSQGYYAAEYIPKKGDRLKITVAANNYRDISAETVIPEVIPIETLDYAWIVNDKNGVINYREHFKITFKDNPDQKEFYLIRTDVMIPIKDWATDVFTGYYSSEPMYVDYSEEPLFTSSISALEKALGYDWMSGYYGRVFSDDLINGQTYTMNLYASGHSFGYGYDENPYDETDTPRPYYRFTLYSISESYYRYMKSVLSIQDETFNSDLAELGLAEPIRVYSNVVGGTGILGGTNPSSKKIEIKPIPR